ncbi:hydrolase TatD [Clostridium pasteurianum]|nr:TatD family hydrolase [Clostridium pasteurianum]AOZ73722.1 hydrolase TatD [Clostridium pasteurianum DSM 525 = ATCC 6013]AOZ77519.1 hydrolase TatD [Clostridium pasteurianum]ELP60854.1 PHP superfamily hydrolase [Clostridium pasteurianum DSM 525 = ATCC 6013]OMH22011.1 hydrolase TatD [Clostridium pasteurianum]UZW14457.1 TatD family hydrolase [Clostridium pasteurianum]
MIFDSHAHYDDEAFNKDRDEVIEELKENEIIGVLNCGASLEGARDSVKLSDKYDFFYAAVGIHPEFADVVNDEIIEELRNLSKNPKVKAIGEIGLDYHYEENPPREVQKDAFLRQMKLAEELGFPVVIHNREAHGDTLEILKQFPKVRGVIHCFSGSLEMARECIKLGYYIGFTGVVTFKNARKTAEVAREIPLDRILLETDCPYMAPEPNRGKRNRSDYIEYIAEKIAEIRRDVPINVKNQAILNTKRLFNIH